MSDEEYKPRQKPVRFVKEEPYVSQEACFQTSELVQIQAPWRQVEKAKRNPLQDAPSLQI